MKENDMQTLENVLHLFDEKRLAEKDFLTEDMRVKHGTKVILTTTDSGGLTVEAMTAGAWSHTACYVLGWVDESVATTTMLRIFMGEKPLSDRCKQYIRAHLLYLANGNHFPRSRLQSLTPFQHMNDWQRPGAPLY